MTTDPVGVGESRERHPLDPEPADLHDLPIGQFGVDLLPDQLGPVPELIRLVLAIRAKSEVVDPVVHWIAIIVAADHAFGSGSDERFQDEAVDVVAFFLDPVAESLSRKFSGKKRRLVTDNGILIWESRGKRTAFAFSYPSSSV